MTMRTREIPKTEPPKANAVIQRLFGSETADSVARAVLRDRNCTSLFAGLAEADVAKLEPITKALISKHIKPEGDPAHAQASVGFNASKDLVKIVKLLSAEPSLLDKISSEGLDSSLSPHAACRQLKKMIGELHNKTGSAFSISIGTGRYEVVFDPNDKNLQSCALENPNTCFSIGGIYRNFSEAYLQSRNIFFAAIKDTKEGQGGIVGRFTVGIGYDIAEDPETWERHISEQTFTEPQMVMARLSDVHPVGRWNEFEMDRALAAYAEHERRNGNPIRCISEGNMIISIPSGIPIVYDEKVHNIMVRYRNGIGSIQLSALGDEAYLLYDPVLSVILLEEFESTTTKGPQVLAQEMIRNIEYGDIKSALRQLNEGADLWYRNPFGETPLHVLADRFHINKNLEILTAILGAIPGDRDVKY